MNKTFSCYWSTLSFKLTVPWFLQPPDCDTHEPPTNGNYNAHRATIAPQPDADAHHAGRPIHPTSPGGHQDPASDADSHRYTPGSDLTA